MYTFVILMAFLLLAMAMLDKAMGKNNFAFALSFSGKPTKERTTRSMFNWNSAVSYMKAKFGAIVTDGRGKIGGHVASKNRSGSYFRTKVTPVNRNTSFQAAVRNRLAGLSQSWRTLTAAQIAAWNAAVADFSKTNIFGDTVLPTGFNLYQALNNNLIRIGGTTLTDPPTPAGIDDLILGALTATADDGVISLAYTPAIEGDNRSEVYATAPLSAGVSFVKSEFRLIGDWDPSAVSPLVLTTLYANKFGSITGAAGKKIFVKTVTINTQTGQAGIPQQTSAVIAAT